MSLVYPRTALDEPESEVHSIEQNHLTEGEIKMKETLLLGDLVTTKSTKLIQMRESEDPQCPDSTPSNSPDESKTQDPKTLGSLLDSKFSWSEDGDEKSHSDGFGHSIHDSILAIQEEASKVDAIMAVDKLDTLKEELRTLRRELQNRTAEVEELQAMVQLKDSRIGTLELERDLYKADTAELQNDLKQCISRLSGNSSSFSLKENEERASALPEQQPTTPSPNSSSIATETTAESSPEQATPIRGRPLDPPSCADMSSADTRTTLSGSVQFNRQTRSVPALPVCEKPKITAETTRNQKRRSVQRRLKGGAFPFCRPSFQKQDKVKRQSSREEEPLGISLQDQVEEMNQRLMTSIAASEELRRRLAMLSRYYDGVVADLKDAMADIKSESTQMEFDLTRQMATIARENKDALKNLEAKLSEKENEIKVLRQQQKGPASFSPV